MVNRRASWTAATLGAFLVVGACEVLEPVAPGETALWIFAAVVEGTDSVFLSVGEAGLGRPNRGVPGSSFSLADAAGATEFVEHPEERCGGPIAFTCLITRRATTDLVSDQLLQMSGSVPGHGPVSGITVTPAAAAVRVAGAAPGDTVRLPELGQGRFIRLEVSGGEEVVLIEGPTEAPFLATRVWTAEGPRTCSAGFGVPIGTDLRQASTVPMTADLWVGPPAGCDAGPPVERWDSLELVLPILTYDPNLSAWHRSGRIVDERSRLGVDGAFGVFGSAALRNIVVRASSNSWMGRE